MTDESVFSLNGELLEEYEFEGDKFVSFWLYEKASTGYEWNTDTSQCLNNFILASSSYEKYWGKD